MELFLDEWECYWDTNSTLLFSQIMYVLSLEVRSQIYSRLSRSFTARGFSSRDLAKDICMKLAKIAF